MDVTTKMSAALVCEHRPLRPGETPKRKGQNTVFEATGNLSEQFLKLWEDPAIVKKVTIKHDGMCSKIAVVDATVHIYRRLDVRKGNAPPPGAVPSDKNDAGEIEFYWIEVTESTDYADFYYLSAFKKKDNKVDSVSVVQIQDGKFEFVEIEASKLTTGTYELIGPKIQLNRYNIPLVNVTIQAVKKGNLKPVDVPKHYFIKHGVAQIENSIIPKAIINPDPVGVLREFIVSNSIEGLVIHFMGVCMFKVNRGHIGVELGAKDPLQLVIQPLS